MYPTITSNKIMWFSFKKKKQRGSSGNGLVPRNQVTRVQSLTFVYEENLIEMR